MRNNHILAVTGEYTYKEAIQKEALKRNFHVDYVKTMDEGLDMLLDEDYVLVVIRADTVDYLPLLRVMKHLKPVPVLVFSYVEPTDKIEALQKGANVYITTPYNLDYIIESGYSLAQLYEKPNGRYELEQPTFLTYEYIRLCIESRQAFLKGKIINLTTKEFNVLCLLMENMGNVITYQNIFIQVWGDEYFDNSYNVLSRLISRLKKKLSVEPRAKNYIKNKYNEGYSFDPS